MYSEGVKVELSGKEDPIISPLQTVIHTLANWSLSLKMMNLAVNTNKMSHFDIKIAHITRFSLLLLAFTVSLYIMNMYLWTATDVENTVTRHMSSDNTMLDIWQYQLPTVDDAGKANLITPMKIRMYIEDSILQRE